MFQGRRWQRWIPPFTLCVTLSLVAGRGALALDGPMMSIRRFGVDLLQMEDLIRFGALTEEVAQVLRGIVKAEMRPDKAR